MNKNNIISLALIILISIFIGISHSYTPLHNTMLQEKYNMFATDFDLEEFIINNEPDELDISDFPITEAFQFTTDIDKVYNKWELIRGDLASAKLKNDEAQALAIKQSKLIKEDKIESDALIASITKGNSKNNAQGIFTDLKTQSRTGHKYLYKIQRDLKALENEAGLRAGNKAAAVAIITGQS